MITLTAKQTLVIAWMANRLDPPANVSYSVEDVNNQGGVYQVRTVTFTRGVDSYSCNLDADLALPNGPTVAMAWIREALDHNPKPTLEYFTDIAPPSIAPPPPPAPKYRMEVIDANHQIEYDGAKSRTRTLTPFGWSVGEWQ